VPVLLRLLAVVALVAAAAALGAWWRRRQGRVTAPAAPRLRPEELAGLGLARIDADVTAVLLASPSCGPCTTAKRVLGQVAAGHPGFEWVEVDAGHHLDLVRAHRVTRLPTLLLVERTGRVLARITGVPAAGDVIAQIERADGDHPLPAA
jgi:hypothetical protein